MKHLEDFKKEFCCYEYLSLVEFRTMIVEMIEFYIDEVDEWYYQGNSDYLPIRLDKLTDIPKGDVKVGFIKYDYFVGLAYRYSGGDVQIYNHHKTTANIVVRPDKGWRGSNEAMSYITLMKEININKLIDKI